MQSTFIKTKEGKMVFTLLSDKGDERKIWDFEDPQEVEEALEEFNKYVSDKQYTALILDEDGNSEGMVKKKDWDKLDIEQRRQFFDKPKEVVFLPLQFGG